MKLLGLEINFGIYQIDINPEFFVPKSSSAKKA